MFLLLSFVVDLPLFCWVLVAGGNRGCHAGSCHRSPASRIKWSWLHMVSNGLFARRCGAACRQRTFFFAANVKLGDHLSGAGGEEDPWVDSVVDGGKITPRLMPQAPAGSGAVRRPMAHF